jgi:hypothetical protein
MRTVKFIALVTLSLALASPAVGQQHMIHTYWHQLDGPHWIYKPGGISVAGDFVYSFGSNKASSYQVFVSADNGNSWNYPPDGVDNPANSISACAGNGRYCMEGDFFYDSRSGRAWKFNSSENCFIEVKRKPSPLISELVKAAIDAEIAKQESIVNTGLRRVPQAQKAAKKKALTESLVTPWEALSKHFK